MNDSHTVKYSPLTPTILSGQNVEWPPLGEKDHAERIQEVEDAEAIRDFCAEDEQDRNMREQELEQAFQAVRRNVLHVTGNLHVGAHTQISEIHGLALYFWEYPELLESANKWFVEVATLNRHMHRHWTVPEKASLVALLDRFKAVLNYLLAELIGDSVYAPVLRRPTIAQRAQVKKLFVGVSKIPFERTWPFELADIHYWETE